jgi:hypothetical protein
LSSDCTVQQAELVASNKSPIDLAQPMQPNDGSKTHSGAWVARAIIVAVAAAMARFTWGRWGDFQIDSGREIYVPAAILQGKLLYRDVWYMYGMLAPYCQALLFHVFGIHLTVLYVLGLSLTIGAALFLFEIAQQFDLGLPVSVLPSLFFLSEAFYPFIFNFVFPYSYAASLAAFFGLACTYFVIRHVSEMRTVHLGWAALFAALAVLTKQEFGLTCLILLGFDVAATYLRHRSARQFVIDLAVCVAGLSPAVAVYGWFTWKLSARLIYFDNWIATPGTYFMRTYGQHMMAINGFRFEPRELISLAFLAFLSLTLWYGIASANALAMEKRREPRFIAIVVALNILVVSMIFLQAFKQMTVLSFITTQITFPQGIFFLGIYFTIHALWKLWKAPSSGLAFAEAALGIYAIVSSARVMLELVPSPYKYSVFFNAPLYLIFVILITRLIRRASRSLAPNKLNLILYAMLGVEAVVSFVPAYLYHRYAANALTTEFGTFYTRKDVSVLFPQIIDFMKVHTRNGKDILFLPEPPSLYVFAGLQSPSRWYSLLPGELSQQGEQDFIKEVTENDVRYVLVSNRAMPEYGVVSFGVGYDGTIYQWIQKNFKKVAKFGPLPSGFPDPYQVSVYERKDLNSTAQ